VRLLNKVRLDAIAATLVGLVGFAYRFLAHTSFNNDQFVHLAKAQAWLAGDWPLRDFTDVGAFLTIGTSALAQVILGQSLLPELLLSVAALGAGAAVTCWVTTRLTGSRTLGIMAAILQIVVLPRLYSYPKMLLYPVLLLCLHRYADSPSLNRLFIASLWVAIAFLFRHDHGVYAAAATGLTLVLVHWSEGFTGVAKRVGTFAVIVLACLAPFLIYVQTEVGLLNYVRLGLETSQGEASRTRVAAPSFRIASGPMLVRRPAAAEELARINIRWAAHVDENARAADERRVPLLFAEHVEGRTWRYRIDWSHAAELRQLLDGMDVEDVSGVDRQTLEFDTRQTISRIVLNTIGLRGLTPGPALTSVTDNASTLLYYSAWTLPLIAFLVWVWRRNASLTSSGHPLRVDARVPVLCALLLLCTTGFQRDEPAIRTPDVFGTFPILLAWLIAALVAVREEGRTRLASRVLAAALVTVIGASVIWVGSAGEMLSRTGVLSGPRGIVAREATTVRSARDWPWAGQWPGDEEWRLARYVHDCTRTGDRLLVTWFAPEYYLFSRRPFAGREVVLMPLYREPATYEARVLESWMHQRVPIVLAEATTYSRFAEAYPALADHLGTHYRRVGDTPWEASTITVYADRSRTASGRDAEFGWDCFSSASEDPAP
jgi:hypothetical protein